MSRCAWVTSDPLYMTYHDEEWGVPVYDDLRLFEFLILEGAQAGLSWLTILRKRDGYREAFAGFDPAKVAQFTESDVERLMLEPRIVRNRRKIQAAVQNAQAFLRVQEEFGSFAYYVWSFVHGRPIVNSFTGPEDVPAKDERSDQLSRDLRRRGFAFVGSTICYSFLQATGMVMDHTMNCFRYAELAK